MKSLYRILIIFLIASIYTTSKVWKRPEKGKKCESDKDCPKEKCCARMPEAIKDPANQKLEYFCFDKQKLKSFCPLEKDDKSTSANEFLTKRWACPCLDDLKCQRDNSSEWGRYEETLWGRCVKK